MKDWIPGRTGRGGPRYLDIVNAMESDIASGVLPPGHRLLPHRDMAEQLGVSVGTVSKAYAEAIKRGLIAGEVGRGTFVLRSSNAMAQPSQPGGWRVNMALNAPPATGEDAVIAGALGEIMADPGLAGFLSYLPHQGRQEHRTAMSAFLNAHGMPTTPDSVFITHGAQHAISLALGMLARSGDTVLAESLTYSGMLALAGQTGYTLRGVLMDREGLLPAQLDRAFSETGARVLYAMPTLQTPTGAVMSDARRAEIVEIIERHDAYLIEDDAYGFLCDPPVAPLSSRIPERSFYVMSFAKCLSPGLRMGAMHVPSSFRDRCINAIRSTGWMATPIMAEVVTRLIQSGRLEDQIIRKRETARRRCAIARRVLGQRIMPRTDIPAFHVWMQMPAGRTTTAMVTQAAQAGVTIAAPLALHPFDPMSNGIRLCLGAPGTEAELEHALGVIANILDNVEAISLV